MRTTGLKPYRNDQFSEVSPEQIQTLLNTFVLMDTQMKLLQELTRQSQIASLNLSMEVVASGKGNSEISQFADQIWNLGGMKSEILKVMSHLLADEASRARKILKKS